jgi:hypothetical protein
MPKKQAPPSSLKNQAVRRFRDHVSSGKTAFFEKYGMDFVMGRRTHV